MALAHGAANQVDGRAIVRAKSPPPATTVTLTDTSGNSISVTESGIWSVRVEDSTGNNLTSTSNALDINLKSTNVTQPISGTVTANAGTGDFNTLPAIDTFVSGAANTAANTSIQVLAPVASKSLYVNSYSVSNSSVTSVIVTFQNGSAGTTLWVIEVPANSTVSLASDRPLFKTSSGVGLYFISSASVSTIYCNAAGFSE